jgi:hypothetical protein
MLLLNVFAVLCTVEIIDEKKSETAFPGDAGFSSVGVKGAGTMFESLLGPILAEPALRRWEIMFPF